MINGLGSEQWEEWIFLELSRGRLPGSRCKGHIQGSFTCGVAKEPFGNVCVEFWRDVTMLQKFIYSLNKNFPSSKRYNQLFSVESLLKRQDRICSV